MLGKNQSRHALKWGTCSNSNTEQQYSTVGRQRTGVGFKLAVRSDSRAGGFHGSASTLYSILQ